MAAPKKKVVRVPAASKDGNGTTGPVWSPSPENKAKATKLRIFAWVAWIVAIAVEAYAIYYVVTLNVEANLWLLVGLLAVTAVLAIAGNLLWRRSNELDPASKANKAKFLVQNQLGALMTVLAFLPLIIIVLLSKNLDGKEKAIVGGIGGVLLVAIVALTGLNFNPPSQEENVVDASIMTQLTGQDLVFWTKSGSVFHVCESVPDVNKESADGTIYSGTVNDAHDAGKVRLTKRWESEATNYCGYSQDQVDAVKNAVGDDLDFKPGSDTSDKATSGTEAPTSESSAPASPSGK